MNILSLFDGISCGMVALERAGIMVDKYYSSEIDKYAIQISQKNYPNIIQLGDILKVDVSTLDKIDLLIGGSPCQGFSFAGKQLNFDDPRSKLFFEYVRILKDIQKYNPNVLFLLENVKMKKEYQDIISKELGVEPIEINSALVSAQNRKRLYWTNIPNIAQPEDKGIFLKDILQDNIDSKYNISDKHTLAMKNCRSSKELNIPDKNGKCGTIIASYYKTPQDAPYIKTNIDKKYYLTESNIKTINRNFGSKGKIIDLSCDSLIEKFTYPSRIKQKNGDIKVPTLTASMGTGGGNVPVILKNTSIRKLTPIECERLQTLPDNYTEGVSDTQRYKALGNGWTVDIITHIFKQLIK